MTACIPSSLANPGIDLLCGGNIFFLRQPLFSLMENPFHALSATLMVIIEIQF